MLGGGNGAMNGYGGGLGLGDGLAAQLLSVSAFKPMIDKILSEAGFPAGPDALTSLTSALAQKTPDAPPAETLAIPADVAAPPPATISGMGKATLGPKS